jgi:hypothetical protein
MYKNKRLKTFFTNSITITHITLKLSKKMQLSHSNALKKTATALRLV